ncbi:putative cytochrome C assembly protein [Janibacter sp. HTCC2649]|uniref:c-type cytochrome biogenesis protein CcsB n=1 Tax=Janibacter sp. HTCC2649 TaxID=313589 RepID=UPI0000670917|nr:c-type cytochrome biogenesis protein CcsB [Janibacter sp. HTCC2649]EAQ00344.1 putative cytochrome C assembly protein [Janibacter sp. HTCC2649]
MTHETMANYANLSLYSAMAVLTLSMLGYAAYLAGWLPTRDAAATSVGAEVAAEDRELVSAGVGSMSGGVAPEAGVSTSTTSEVPLRARKAGGIAQTLALLGTVLLFASAALRGWSVERWPLGNMFEFGVAASLFTMMVFVIAGTRRDLRWLGVFVVAPVLILLGLANTVWYTEAAELMPSLKSVWLIIHVTVATISVGLFAVGATVALLYLAKDRFGETTGGFRVLRALPDSRALERFAYSLHIIAFPLWTFTLIAGAIWARQAWGSYWNWDPKEVWTFIIWVVYAAYLHARVTRGWRRQSASWVAVAGFACIIINYAVVNVYFVGQHSYSGL